MKRLIQNLLVALTVTCGVNQLIAQGTAFTYQGQLNFNGNLANGNYDFKLQVYNDPSAGSVIGGPVTNTLVAVSNGLFTTLVDFGGGVFTGSSNWLQLRVRTNGNGGFTALSPRQQLTPTPYAIFAESANAAGLTGTVPAADLSLTGVSGSGLINLNASQLTSGTVPNAALPPDVALLDAPGQTFTGVNTFAGPGESLIINGGPINTSLFTGLGLQYSTSGEGAIMSSYNDGFGFLTFYTKQATGYPIQQVARIDRWGGLRLDQQGYNSGTLNDSTTNGVGLTFGVNSGEGIASDRVSGVNRYGLDFYTSFAHRMSILNNGNVGIGTTNPASLLEVNGNIRADGGSVSIQPAGSVYSTDGLVWGNGGLPGINGSTASPFLAGYLGGALGAWAPNTVCLSWDAGGDVWVSNYLSAATLYLRGYGSSTTESISVSGQNVIATGEFLAITGLGGVQPYIGDDGHANDVQIGSLTSGVTGVSCYNAADNVFMHLFCSSITIEGGADLAEPFKITGGDGEVPQGAVVVIDEANPGHLKLSDQAYDTRVAGVVSGANGINPGIQMQQQGILEGGKNVALTGRVYVKADTSNGAIKPGDLLTTSSSPGFAMKVTDHAKAMGAILGKAMTGLSDREGMVLVLVTLQ